jgi:hypothetical protein
VLVLPLLLTGSKSFAVLGVGWWICDFGNQVSSRGFCDPVDEHAEKWYLQEYIESDPKSKEEAFSVMKPALLLLLCESDARKIWL